MERRCPSLLNPEIRSSSSLLSLYTLIDSPVISGHYFRMVRLTPPAATPAAEMDIAADSAAAIEMPPNLETSYKNLVAEATTLFGATHYRDYHFLYSLSDHVAHFGLEHHESDDSRTYERTLINYDQGRLEASSAPARIRALLEWKVSPSRRTHYARLRHSHEGRVALGLRRAH